MTSYLSNVYGYLTSLPAKERDAMIDELQASLEQEKEKSRTLALTVVTTTENEKAAWILNHALNKKYAKLMLATCGFEKSKQELSTDLSASKADAVVLKSKNDALTAEMLEKDQELNTAKAMLAAFENTMAEYLTWLCEKSDRLDTISAKLDKIGARVVLRNQKFHQQSKEAERMKDEIEFKTNALREAYAENAGLKKALKEMTGDAEASRLRSVGKSVQMKGMKDMIADAKVKNEENACLHETVTAMKADAKNNNSELVALRERVRGMKNAFKESTHALNAGFKSPLKNKTNNV